MPVAPDSLSRGRPLWRLALDLGPLRWVHRADRPRRAVDWVDTLAAEAFLTFADRPSVRRAQGKADLDTASILIARRRRSSRLFVAYNLFHYVLFLLVTRSEGCEQDRPRVESNSSSAN